MMDLETIKRLNDVKGREAEQKGKLPLSILDKKDRKLLQKMAFIGNYRPKGFKVVNEYFVDNSGFGAIDEPALSFEQFTGKVKEGHAYAIVEAGQFQVWIAEFEISNTMKKKQLKLRKKLQKIEEGIRFFNEERQEVKGKIMPSEKKVVDDDTTVVYQQDLEVGDD